MSPALKINPYRDKLHALRARLDSHVAPMSNGSIGLADSADRAAQQTEVAVDIGLVVHEAAVRKEIDDALDRIDAGTFATCARCHHRIGARRLNAIPYARFCVRCERRIEQEGPRDVKIGA